jgi:hypothetical protein
MGKFVKSIFLMGVFLCSCFAKAAEYEFIDLAKKDVNFTRNSKCNK